MSRLSYQPDRYAVVCAAKPDRLHRADCPHLFPSHGVFVRPARVGEARTLPVCKFCEKAERREATP